MCVGVYGCGRGCGCGCGCVGVYVCGVCVCGVCVCRRVSDGVTQYLGAKNKVEKKQNVGKHCKLHYLDLI